MIQAFEKILDDSIIKGISIFDNPDTRLFIKQYKDYLSNPNAINDIEECVEKNRNECEKYLGEIPSQLNFDIELLFLALWILIYSGEEVFEKIEWLK